MSIADRLPVLSSVDDTLADGRMTEDVVAPDLRLVDDQVRVPRLEPDGHPKAPPVMLAGVPLDAIDLKQAVTSIADHAERNGVTSYVVTPNAQHVVLHQRDPLFRTIYQNAFLVATDGVPLLWATRFLGRRLPGRINGTDLFEELCVEAARRNLRVFLLGGSPGSADAAAAKLIERNPALNICGTYCPDFGFEWDPFEQAKIINAVNASRAHLVFVGLGAPKQEYWMYRNRPQLTAPMLLGVGASFELVGGVIPRAPRWMQRAGLEWFYRLVREPERLWKRYLIGNTIFCMLVVREFLGKRKAG